MDKHLTVMSHGRRIQDKQVRSSLSYFVRLSGLLLSPIVWNLVLAGLEYLDISLPGKIKDHQ